MVAVLLNGFINGSFSEDGAELLANPWGIVSLVDLYVGFILFSMWIVFREPGPLSAAIWVVLMMVFGFLAGAVYVLYALHTCGGDWTLFFLGARRDRLIQGSRVID